MAQDASFNGLRAQVLTSLFGRRHGIDKNDFLVGTRDLRVAIDGVPGGSTVISTGYGVGAAGSSRLQAWGVSVVGATVASASTGYLLDAPVPGTYKTIFNASTGTITLSVADAGANIITTALSTATLATLPGKGTSLQLFALSTALWASLTQAGLSTVGANNIIFS